MLISKGSVSSTEPFSASLKTKAPQGWTCTVELAGSMCPPRATESCLHAVTLVLKFPRFATLGDTAFYGTFKHKTLVPIRTPVHPSFLAIKQETLKWRKETLCPSGFLTHCHLHQSRKSINVSIDLIPLENFLHVSSLLKSSTFN